MQNNRSNEQWAYYQTRGIKAIVMTTKVEILDALGKPTSEKDKAEATRFGSEIDKVKDKAHDMEKQSIESLESHEQLASAVTMFQICIAVSAVSVLTHRRMFWWVSLVFAAIGIGYMALGFWKH